MIYLDNAATTRICWNAREKEDDLWDTYGNPASRSAFGQKARRVIEDARDRIARKIGAGFGEVYFTCGATEGNNWAIRGAVETDMDNAPFTGRPRPHVITVKTEHHSVLNTVKALEERGVCTASYVDADPETGAVRAESVIRALRPETVLVSAMLINNETGARNPVEEIGTAICNYNRLAARRRDARHVLFHTDATQALGKIPVNVDAIRCDMLTASGHKFHAGKGCGIMYLRRGTRISNLMEGGGQQMGLRPGTEDTGAAVRIASALEDEIEWCVDARLIRDMTEYLLVLLYGIEGARINGKPCLESGIVNVSFDGVLGEALLVMLEKKGVVCSSGSACAMGEESHVLAAMGIERERILNAVRISVGRLNRMQEITDAARILKECVRKLRREE